MLIQQTSTGTVGQELLDIPPTKCTPYLRSIEPENGGKCAKTVQYFQGLWSGQFHMEEYGSGKVLPCGWLRIQGYRSLLE